MSLAALGIALLLILLLADSEPRLAALLLAVLTLLFLQHINLGEQNAGS